VSGGTGLGLTISQEIIEMHGGKMEVESALGAGSTFTFSLPLSEPRAEPSAHRWSNPYTPYQPRTRRSMAPPPTIRNAFVVLDAPNGALARAVTRHNTFAETYAVASVDEAVALLERSMADAVLFNKAICSAGEYTRLVALLPEATVAIGCDVPQPTHVQSAPERVQRISKPVSRETLLHALAELGNEVRDVLIVDDNLEVLQLFARILTSADPAYRVLRATGGRQALQMLRRRKPDALILDLKMPDMGGDEVLEAMGSDPVLRNVPVLVVTSQIDREQATFGHRLDILRPRELTLHELLSLLSAVTASLQSKHLQAPPETPLA
jgi:CheY-like chemotaxis protein